MERLSYRNNLNCCGCRLDATLNILRRKPVPSHSSHEERFVAEVLVRKVPDDQQVS